MRVFKLLPSHRDPCICCSFMWPTQTPAPISLWPFSSRGHPSRCKLDAVISNPPPPRDGPQKRISQDPSPAPPKKKSTRFTPQKTFLSFSSIRHLAKKKSVRDVHFFLALDLRFPLCAVPCFVSSQVFAIHLRRRTSSSVCVRYALPSKAAGIICASIYTNGKTHAPEDRIVRQLGVLGQCFHLLAHNGDGRPL